MRFNAASARGQNPPAASKDTKCHHTNHAEGRSVFTSVCLSACPFPCKPRNGMLTAHNRMKAAFESICSVFSIKLGELRKETACERTK